MTGQGGSPISLGTIHWGPMNINTQFHDNFASSSEISLRHGIDQYRHP